MPATRIAASSRPSVNVVAGLTVVTLSGGVGVYSGERRPRLTGVVGAGSGWSPRSVSVT